MEASRAWGRWGVVCTKPAFPSLCKVAAPPPTLLECPTWSDPFTEVRGEDRDTFSCCRRSPRNVLWHPPKSGTVMASSVGDPLSRSSHSSAGLLWSQNCVGVFRSYFNADYEELEYVRSGRGGLDVRVLLYEEEGWGRENARRPRYSATCRAGEKSDFHKNWAALEGRTLKPVRGDLQYKGRFHFSGRQSCVAASAAQHEIEGSPSPVAGG